MVANRLEEILGVCAAKDARSVLFEEAVTAVQEGRLGTGMKE